MSGQEEEWKEPVYSPNEANMELFKWMYYRSGFSITEDDKGIHFKKHKTKFRLRSNSSDKDVFSQVFCNWQYLPLADLLKLNHIEAKTVVDLGANTGMASIYFHEFFPDARYICVEPDSGNMQMLKENTAGIRKKILLHKAIWKSNETVYVDHRFRDGLEWSAHTSSEQQEGDEPVNGITLNKIIADYDLKEISILKIDIEGAEQMLFEGDAYKQFLPKVRTICIELHDEAGPTEPILDKIRSMKFGLWKWGESIYGLNYSLLP